MMNYQLTLRSLLERAEQLFPAKEIVSRTSAGLFRYTYAEYGKRTRRLSSALQAFGIEPGDRIATFAWNHHRHLEAYFAIPCLGAVLHTVNIRLAPDHLIYILNHAEDKVLLVDEELLPVIEGIHDQLKTVEAYIVMTDQPEVPSTTLAPVYSYEEFLKTGTPDFAYTEPLDENAPMGLCYTSATTGNPKGVVFTHRSTYLHSLTLGLADTIGLSECDTTLPVVPMFHANAWGLPFAAVWFGTKQVLPGPAPTPKVLLDLIAGEQVTLAAGVPTVWLGLLKELEKQPADLSSLRSIVCGGSAAPRGIIETYQTKYKIPFIHAYGMTEASPLVSVARLKSYQKSLSNEEILDIRSKQGILVPGLEMRAVGQNGDVSWNGQEMGELLFRGPWIADEYFLDERTRDTFYDGWYHSGDVAVIDSEGFIKLVDRQKDLVKSGGEWISSVDLENELMAHPAVFEACVVGVPHPKWDERPVACVVLKDSYQDQIRPEELLDFLRPKFAKWWIPDEVIFLPEIPKTIVGKFLKRELRSQLKDHFQSN